VGIVWKASNGVLPIPQELLLTAGGDVTEAFAGLGADAMEETVRRMKALRDQVCGAPDSVLGLFLDRRMKALRDQVCGAETH
jgi:hypothetical protein